MSAERVSIPISSDPLYEATAIFLGVIAYPSDQKQRDRYVSAFCREVVRMQAMDDEKFADSQIAFRPKYLRLSDVDAREQFEAGFREIELRKAAVISTWALFDEALAGKAIEFLEDPRGSKLKNTPGNRHLMTIHWLGKEGDNSPKNVTSRIEAPARPVIHAAYALWRYVLKARGAVRKSSMEMSDLDALRLIFFDRDIMEALLKAVTFYRQTALSIPALKVTDSDLIEFVQT